MGCARVREARASGTSEPSLLPFVSRQTLLSEAASVPVYRARRVRACSVGPSGSGLEPRGGGLTRSNCRCPVVEMPRRFPSPRTLSCRESRTCPGLGTGSVATHAASFPAVRCRHRGRQPPGTGRDSNSGLGNRKTGSRCRGRRTSARPRPLPPRSMTSGRSRTCSASGSRVADPYSNRYQGVDLAVLQRALGSGLGDLP